jgi:hypothetical protein
VVGLVRLICNPTIGKSDDGSTKVYDVPKHEAENLKRRLEKSGWQVTVEFL